MHQQIPGRPRLLKLVASAVTALLLAAGIGVVDAVVGPVAPVAAAGCASATKSIGGAFVGEDGRRLSGQVGIALFDGAGQRINSAGCPFQPGDDGGSGYTFYVGVNTVNGCCFTLPAAGAAANDTRYENTWRINGLPSNAATAWVETYPKSAPTHQTDYSRYGGAMLRSAPVNLNVDMRLPLDCSAGGDNGSIAGKARRNGSPVPVRNVVAFSRAAEGTGQILGFVAIPAPGTGDGAFTVPQLEPNQSYALSIELTDGSQYWFENDYGDGLPVSPCATTSRTFDLMADGTAVASQAPPSGLSGVDMGSSKFVFYRGEDNALWYKSGSNVVSLGGQIQGDPDATFFNGGIAVVARGANNSIWQRQFQGGSWGPWKDLGGITIQSPTIVSWGGTRLDVFIAGGDSQLWHRWSDDGQNWSRWQGMGGILTAAPDAASWGFNRIDLGVRGGDGALWHMYWANGWSGWESLGGQLLGGPGVTAPASNRVDFAVRGTNNGVFLKSWNGAQWVGWSWLDGGMTIADPDLSASSGRTTVYVRGSNSLFYADTRSSPASAFGGWVVP